MSERQFAIGGVVIDVLELSEVVQELVSRRLTGDVHLCNAYTIALAAERRDFAESLDGAALNLPDGTPLAWFARRRGFPGCLRVYGPDLMRSVIDAGQLAGLAHYLYGSTPEVLDALAREIGSRWPDAVIAGVESPPFSDISDDEVRASAERMAESGADVVWVGMGTPKQDLLVRHFAEVSPLVFVAVGAAFDFIAGTKRQAPTWVQRVGLEWLFRLAIEPRRLARRYIVYNMRFLRLMWRNRGEISGPAAKPVPARRRASRSDGSPR